MSTDDPNPYQPAAIDPNSPFEVRESLEYMRAIHYVFESPKWTMNLLWGSLCLLSTQAIPIVGQLLWIGYQFEIVENLFRNPGRQGYPDFDMNRFKEYLLRGLWIFLVMLVMMLVLMPIMLVLFLGGALVVGGIGAATGGDDEAMAVGMIALIVLGGILGFVIFTLMTIVITPVTLRAGLTQDFRASFDIAWIKDFMRRMWVETLLSQLFLMAVGILAEVVGLLACIIGVFPAIALIFLVQGHLFLQLYQLYLARGGRPIQLKEDTAIPPAKPV